MPIILGKLIHFALVINDWSSNAPTEPLPLAHEVYNKCMHTTTYFERNVFVSDKGCI